jgi:hypothetical protein
MDLAPPKTSSPWDRLTEFLREADWLTADRVRTFTRIWLIISVLAAAIWLALTKNNVDPLGKAIGADFASFWAASTLSLAGHPADVYNLSTHISVQDRLFGRDVSRAVFFYPPIFLCFCLPLAYLPYLTSLAVWLGATGLAYARVIRAWLGRSRSWVAILAFPAVIVNAGHGQNGFLSAALFGGAILLLDRRPLLAGVLLGCLAYKPQLGLVIPLALLASRRWPTIVAAAATVAGLGLLSLAMFGLDTWRAFLGEGAIARAALERNLIGDAKMQSVFAAIRLLHGSITLAYGAQIAAALIACMALFVLQRKAFRTRAEGPAMVLAALLSSPFLLDYDLILLAIPLAWLVAEGLQAGFWPWEKLILAMAFILPAVSRNIALSTGVPLGPFVIAALFWLVLRRGWGRSTRHPLMHGV